MWRWRRNSLTFRLTGTLMIALALLFLASAMVQLGMQDRYARGSTAINGQAMAETLFGALHTTMLANDRGALAASMKAIAANSPHVRLRIFNK